MPDKQWEMHKIKVRGHTKVAMVVRISQNSHIMYMQKDETKGLIL